MDSTGLVVLDVPSQSSASRLVKALVNICKCLGRVHQLAQCLSLFHPAFETSFGSLQICFSFSGTYQIAFNKLFLPDKISNISMTSSFSLAPSMFPARDLNINSSSFDWQKILATLFTDRFQCTEHPCNNSVISFPKTRVKPLYSASSKSTTIWIG